MSLIEDRTVRVTSKFQTQTDIESFIRSAGFYRWIPNSSYSFRKGKCTSVLRTGIFSIESRNGSNVYALIAHGSTHCIKYWPIAVFIGYSIKQQRRTMVPTTKMATTKGSPHRFALLLVLLSVLFGKVEGGHCKAKGPQFQCPNCGGKQVSDCFQCDGFLSTDDLHGMCIDRKLFQPYNVDTEDHENHYHFLWQDLAAMLIWFVMGGIATACGVGGGGIYVPLGMLLLQFSPRQASGLSQCSIFGATLGGLIINVRDLHPAQDITDAPGELAPDGRRFLQQKHKKTSDEIKSKDTLNSVFYTRPRISYDMTLYLAPVEMAGAVVGVLIQTFLPNWAFLMIAGLVLLFTSYKTYCKFFDARRTEKKHAEDEMAEKAKLDTATEAEEVFSEETPIVELSSAVAKEDSEQQTATDGSSRTLDGDNEADYELRKKYLQADMRQYPTEKIVGLIALWIGVLILTLLRGGRGVASLVGITCESPWFGILIAIQFTWLFGFAGFFAVRLLADQKKRVAVRYPYQLDDVVWDLRSLRVFGIYTFFAGVIAGLIGIGGGMVRHFH